jgi:hypothetical protein
MKTTLVTYEQFSQLEFNHPATFYVRLADGNYLYVHSRSRDKCQEFIDNEYGVGHYTVKASKLTQSKPKYLGHNISAR